MEVLAALVAAGLGFIAGVFLHLKQAERAASAKLFDKYLEARDELTDILSELASLALIPLRRKLDYAAYAERLSKCFYRHYDVLPERVLMEINCLYLCLSKDGAFAYMVDEPTRQIRRLDLTSSQEEMGEFVRSVSLVNNILPITKILVRYKGNARRLFTVNLQARRTVQSIDDNVTFSAVTSWGKKLRKRPILELTAHKDGILTKG